MTKVKIVPRPYQVDGKKSIYAAMKLYRSVCYQLATGGGKTVQALDIITDILKAGKKVMFVAHREELITQAAGTFRKNSIFCGIIKAKVEPNYELPVQVASIQTLCSPSRTFFPEVDVIVFDECHHAQKDNNYGIVANIRYPNAKILGITATPYRLSGLGFEGMYDVLVQGCTFPELTDMGFLTPLEYYTWPIDRSELVMSNGDYTMSSSANAIKLAPLVESYKAVCDGAKGIVYASNVEHSISIAEEYNNAGIPAMHIDGSTDEYVRASAIDRLMKGEIKILTNVGIATEGFDCPDLDFVQLARVTKSLSLYFQKLGRAARVPNHVIQGLETDQARRSAIAASSKPYGIVLDNAGLYIDFAGGAEQNIDWQSHFIGTKTKKKKKEEVEFIEMEYEAMDEKGQVVKSSSPSEVAGMRLIKVNKNLIEAKEDLSVLKDFDKTFLFMERKYGVKGNPKRKYGFSTLFDFLESCKRKNILITDKMWDHMTNKLVKERSNQVESIIKEYNNRISAIEDSENVDDNKIRQLVITRNNRVALFKALSVSEGAMKHQKSKYLRENITSF